MNRNSKNSKNSKKNKKNAKKFKVYENKASESGASEIAAPNAEASKASEAKNPQTANPVQSPQQGPTLNSILLSTGPSITLVGRDEAPIQGHPRYSETASNIEKLTASYLHAIKLLSNSLNLNIDAKIFLMVSDLSKQP
jgi:hypothetical protein